ncbi:ImmA/IrrE family metallo-endopeptidase [Corynebacterium phoceense]|uniref:ImmA/IrrE family metallo-endopeptidase n=1 Tax=Corynebacterium phoceense TaxID=1686286 RepID=UPI001F46DBEC|nr:ImmA/IrrE family metallo-endopeptidase [Corynebacterium phoceense]
MKILLIDALIGVAEGRGYRVRWHKHGPTAAWLPHRNAITLQNGAPEVELLCSLAHELGHAHYNHPAGHFGAHELQADRFAAKLLISPADYAAAEAIYGPHPARLAHELGVTVKVLKTWASIYERKLAA